MHAANSLPWPRFALRPMACPSETPGPARQVLESQGVPERGVGGEYVALTKATFLEGHEGLLAFGESGLDGRVCLDVRTLQVVHVPSPGGDQVNPVNSTVAAFAGCVEAAIVRFPYYTYETADELGEEVAEALRTQLLAIDATVAAHHSLWETFLDDVAMGNYAEEEFDDA